MACKRSFTEEDFSCPVCHDIYKNPLILNCSHSACQACLQQFWESRTCRECPVCRRRSTRLHPPSNLALKNLSETFRLEKSQRDSEQLCSLHNEKFKLFCLDDKQPVCLVCRDSKEHMNHKFRPIDEVTPEYKAEIKAQLDKIKDNLKAHEKNQQTYTEIGQHIKIQAKNTERQIKEEFENLHQFLRNEEAARMAALRVEEEQKSKMMKEKIEEMNRAISSLSDRIRDIEEKMGADDVTFLQNYKSTVERAQCTLQNPEKVSGALINVAKYLGNLKFRVWEKMQQIIKYTPVTLDPNTANPWLVLSEDLTTARRGNERQQLPYNPERPETVTRVLGSEGFNSGTHCWIVEVGDNPWWHVGVMSGSQGGRWLVSYINGKYEVHSPEGPPIVLPVKKKPQRIRVKLEWSQGKVFVSGVRPRPN